MSTHTFRQRMPVVGGLGFALIAPLGAHGAVGAELEEIIVTVPLHREEAETVHPTNLLTGDELRRRVSTTLGATLQQEVGVTYASFGPGVGQPIIRGQGAPRVLVLQDSMPSEDAANTSNDHANAVEAVLAERIEVLRGPATLLYGSGAIGGIVNVIDGRVPSSVPDQTRARAEYRYGDNADTNTFAGRVDSGVGNVALHLSGFTRENDEIEIDGYADADADGEGEKGLIKNSDSEAQQLTGGLSWVADRGFIGLSVSTLDTQYGIPPGAHGHHHSEDESEDQSEEHDEDEFVRIDLEQTRYDLRSEIETPLSWIETLRAYVSYADYEHTELEGDEIGTVFQVESWNTRLEAVHQLGDALHGAFGLQWHDRDFEAIGEEAFVPPIQSQSWGLFLVEEWNSGDLTIELGGRWNHDEYEPTSRPSRDFDTFSLSMSGMWASPQSGALKAALSLSERAPSNEELYSDGVHVATGSYELGDDGLSEESSTNIEIGYHFHTDALNFQLEGFYNRVRDYIYGAQTGEVFNPDLEMTESQCSADDKDECLPVVQWSQQDADFYGLETELKIQLPANAHLSLFGDYVRGELDNSGNVPRLPPLRFGAELGWATRAWDLALRVTEFTDQDRPGENEEETDGYTLVSAHADYRFSDGPNSWTVFIRGDNLLDEEVRNATSVLRDLAPEAGRKIEIGVRVEI